MSKLTQEQDKLQDRQIWEAQSLLLLWGWGPTNNRMIYKLAAMLQYAPASAPEGPCSTCGDGGQDMCSRHRPAPVEQPAQSGASEQAGMVERAIAAARQAGLEADGFEAYNLAVTVTAALRVAMDERDAEWAKAIDVAYREQLSESGHGIVTFMKRVLSRLLAPAVPADPAVQGVRDYLRKAHSSARPEGPWWLNPSDVDKIVAAVDQARAAGGGKP